MSLLKEGNFRVELTPYGQKNLVQNGLTKENMYFLLFDDDVNYQVNVWPTLISDISGEQTKSPDDNINYRYKLNSNG
jgi:hypothetical protein